MKMCMIINDNSLISNEEIKKITNSLFNISINFTEHINYLYDNFCTNIFDIIIDLSNNTMNFNETKEEIIIGLQNDVKEYILNKSIKIINNKIQHK